MTFCSLFCLSQSVNLLCPLEPTLPIQILCEYGDTPPSIHPYIHTHLLPRPAFPVLFYLACVASGSAFYHAQDSCVPARFEADPDFRKTYLVIQVLRGFTSTYDAPMLLYFPAVYFLLSQTLTPFTTAHPIHFDCQSPFCLGALPLKSEQMGMGKAVAAVIAA